MFRSVQLSRTARLHLRPRPSCRTPAAAPSSRLSHRLARRKSLATRRRPIACLSDQLILSRSTQEVTARKTPNLRQNASDAMERRSTRKAYLAKSAMVLEDWITNSSRISKRYSLKKSENTALLSTRNCWPSILSKRKQTKQRLCILASSATAVVKALWWELDTSALSEVITISAKSVSRLSSLFLTQCLRSEIQSWLRCRSCASMRTNLKLLPCKGISILSQLKSTNKSQHVPLCSFLPWSSRPNVFSNQKSITSQLKLARNSSSHGSSRTVVRCNGPKVSVSYEFKEMTKWSRLHGKLQEQQ